MEAPFWQRTEERINKPEVEFELAVDVVDVVFCESDGVVQHVLELGQHVGDLSDDHGQGGDSRVRAGSYVCSLQAEFERV